RGPAAEVAVLRARAERELPTPEHAVRGTLVPPATQERAAPSGGGREPRDGRRRARRTGPTPRGVDRPPAFPEQRRDRTVRLDPRGPIGHLADGVQVSESGEDVP